MFYGNQVGNLRKPAQKLQINFQLNAALKFINHADEKIRKDKRSPGALVGSARIERKCEEKMRVCVKTFYNYIKRGLMKAKIQIWP